MRVCLVVNARAGSGHFDLAGVLAVLRAARWDVVVSARRYGPGELAAEAIRSGYQAVIACGGDGTLREVVAGLLGTPVAVGMIPAGTINLWGRELGIAVEAVPAARQLVRATPRRVDVGRLTINGGPARHFLLMTGLGIDGAVMAHVSPRLKRHLGPAAVAVAALRTVPAARTIPVRVEADGAAWEGRVAQIVVGNTRRYGGFTSITPDALADDGLLDCCLFAPTSVVVGMRQLASLTPWSRPAGHGVIRRRAASLTIHAPAPLPAQLDGDALPPGAQQHAADGGMRYHFSVLAGACTMLVPREYRGALLGGQAGRAAHGNGDGTGSRRENLEVMRLGAVGDLQRAGEPE